MEYESCDDDNHDNNDHKDKKNDNDDFTGMCFMARNNEDESDPDKVRPSYDELKDGLIKLAVELKRTKKKLKERSC